MKLIRPSDFTLSASNVHETPPATYNAGTSYADGVFVSVYTGTLATVYESLVGSNLGNTPASSPTQWNPVSTTYEVYSGSKVYELDEVVIDTTTHHEYQSLTGVNLGTATITIATPGVVTRAAHGLAANTPVCFETSGALPTGLTAGTIYYVRNPAADTFEVSLTSGGASINTTGSQSGTHTLHSNPNVGYALTSDKWLDLGSNNRWRMFDQFNSSQTIRDEQVDVTLNVAGRADGIALLNVLAATIRIVVNDGTSDVYDETHSMVSDSGITDWYAYFFEPIIRSSDLIVTDLPSVAAPEIQVIVDNVNGNVEVGTLVVGQTKDLGATVYGARIGIQDYSRKVTDEFGNFTIVQRAYSKRATFDVSVDNAKIDAITALLATYRATPVVWIGTDLFASTWIYGFYKDFSVQVQYLTKSNLSLEIEGLT